MFTKSEVVSGDKLETVIGKDTSFEGTITTKGAIRIDGEVDGEVFSEGDVTVSESARMSAQISARNVIVSGSVKGNVTATDRVELSGTSRISGDIQAAKLIVDEGALFDGKCSMTSSGGSIQPSKPSEQEKEEEKEEESEEIQSYSVTGDAFKWNDQVPQQVDEGNVSSNEEGENGAKQVEEEEEAFLEENSVSPYAEGKPLLRRCLSGINMFLTLLGTFFFRVLK